ncbi:hypothetical protein O0L34_g8340 [Tuta absoluta]|nr:hypothetical protein O0L34_g8340 [Tuta absoluta]
MTSNGYDKKIQKFQMEDTKEELKKKAQNEDTDPLELVLQHVGEWGRYQKLLFLGMMPFGFFFAFVYFVQMFVVATPQSHWCRVPELEHLDQELRYARLSDAKEELKKKAQNEDIDPLELVLQHVGEWGRYQKLLFPGMMPFGFFFAFVYFVQMFVVATPQSHWCRVPELEHLDQELRVLYPKGNNGNPITEDRLSDAKEELNKKAQNEETDPLELVLQHVGEWGRYQKLLFLGMMPFGSFFAFVYFVQMFVVATPQSHWCRVPELEHLDQELRRNLTAPLDAKDWEWDRCQTYDANWTHVSLTLTPPHPNTSKIQCNSGWEFQLGDIPYHTVVSERGWVCDYAGYAPIAQSIFFGGSFVGGLLFGWLADRFGRVPALVGANLIGCVGGVLTIFTSGLWDFAICRFLVGMSYDSCFILMYILVLEYVGPSHRTWIANMSIAIYFGGGCLALPWIAIWIGNWKILLLATSLPMMIVLAAIFVVPESARWLSSQGKVNKAVEILRKFERVNRTKIPEDVMDDFIVQARQTRQTDESIGALMKSSQLRLMMLFMVIVYMACAIIFDGLVRMSENLGFDFFITFTLTSATEIPSVTLLAFVLDKWGRRNLTVGPLWIAGILSLIAAFVPKGIPQVSLAIMARFCINMAYNTIIQWATELLPTPVRASGSSVVHVSGYVGTVLSPYIVFSDRIWKPLPLLILGIIAMFSGGIAIFLPESMGRNLPQNIVEGERLFNEYSMCGKPERDDVESEEMKNEKEKALIT